MTIEFVGHQGSTRVEQLKYKECFIYQRNVYMRVSFQGLNNWGKINTDTHLHVLKLGTGYTARFARDTYVTPIKIKATIEEIEDTVS